MQKRLIFILFFILPGGVLSADTIKLKSGKVIHGTIVQQTAEYLKVDQGIGINLTYYRDQIDSIKETETDPAIITSGHEKHIASQFKDSKRERLSIQEFLKLRDLFEQKQFVELEGIINGYQQAYVANHIKEDKIFDALLIFSSYRESDENLLLQWQRQMPNSYVPHLALASYYRVLGWSSRGGKWASETTNLQFQSMKMYFNKVISEVQEVIKLNPNVLPAYELAINIYNGLGEDDRVNEYIEKALKIAPESFKIRLQVIQSLRPRWGGSYELMEDFAKDSEQYLDQNPNLKLLRGFIYIDMGKSISEKPTSRDKRVNTVLKNTFTILTPVIDTIENANHQPQIASSQQLSNLKKSKEYYDRAIALGESSIFYVERAENFILLDDYTSALADAKRALVLFPIGVENNITCAKVYYELAQYQESLHYIELAKNFGFDAQNIKDFKNYASNNLVYYGTSDFQRNDFSSASNKFELALKFDLKNPYAYYLRGYLHLTQNMDDQAIADFNKALELKRDLVDAYRALGFLYAKHNNLSESLKMLNKGLAINPNDAGILLERGRCYHLMGKEYESDLDVKRACDLGDQKACQVGGFVR